MNQVWRVVLLALAVAVAFSSGGCASMVASRSAQMQAWVGHSSTELVKAWGPPVSSQPIGDGVQVLTWRSWVPSIGQTGYWRTSGFTVDPQGVVKAFSWWGL
jgi:hypothetical protein